MKELQERSKTTGNYKAMNSNLDSVSKNSNSDKVHSTPKLPSILEAVDSLNQNFLPNSPFIVNYNSKMNSKKSSFMERNQEDDNEGLEKMLPEDQNPYETLEPEEDIPKPPAFYTLVMMTLSLTEGFTLGYMESLMSIFRQKGLHSSQIGVLSFMMYPFMFSFLGSPIVDRYFSSSFGKRKSYLIPCKIIVAISLGIFSFFADELVDNNRVGTIALIYFLLGLVQLFDLNALIGLRFEVYGRKYTGLASFTNYSGIILGLFFGYHFFIILNSDYVCRDLLGFKGALVSHGLGNLFFAVVNVLAGLGTWFIKEKPAQHSEKILSVYKLTKILLCHTTYRKPTLWLMTSCFATTSLRATVALQLIRGGMRREHIVMMLALNAPFNLALNFVLKRFMIPGRILRVASLFTGLYLVAVYVDWFNITTLDPQNHYTRALLLSFVGIVAESACPWMSYHMGFINASTHPRYAATYAGTYAGVVAPGKILPITLTVSLLDYLPYSILFISLNIANLIWLGILFKPVAEVSDNLKPEEFRKAIDEALEVNTQID